MGTTRDAWQKRLDEQRLAVTDRRDTCRYPVRTRTAVLCIDVQGSRVECPVEIENISMQGCLARSRKVPQIEPGQAVWLQLDGVTRTGPIDGVAVSCVKPFLRRYAIRIRFDEALPFLAFKLLVYGSDGIDLDRRDRPDHETDQFWR
jgi:hypothetical protein